MQTLTHGGDWMGYREQFGHDALDFSANVSPLGLPEGVANAIMAALPAADRYPDPLCRTLRAALEQAEGVPAPHILCGNGAADLIFRLVMAAQPRQALVLAPTFAEYAAALETVHCKVKRYYLSEENDFAVTDDLLGFHRRGAGDGLPLPAQQPHGPTDGSRIWCAASRKNAPPAASVWWWTSASLIFCPIAKPSRQSPCWKRTPTSSSSKPLPSSTAWRASGWATASAPMKPCWPGCRARASPGPSRVWRRRQGVAALRETAYVARVRALIADQRPKLAGALRALGLRVIEGKANYLLFQGPADLGERLRPRGVVLRSCANYPGLDGSWYRTAVRTAPENAKLFETLREVLR